MFLDEIEMKLAQLDKQIGEMSNRMRLIQEEMGAIWEKMRSVLEVDEWNNVKALLVRVQALEGEIRKKGTDI